MVTASLAQQPAVDEEDTVQVKVKKPDSLREKFYFRSIRFGTDILALALSGSERFGGWEVNGDIDLGPFYLAADYGKWGKDDVLATGGSYHNDGTYWRAGVDISLLKKDPDRNMFFFGLRYARSSFQEQIVMVNPDPYFGTLSYQLTNGSATAGWGELVAGIRVKIWKEFWMGFTSRMKFALGVNKGNAFTSYDVPGYGIVGDGANWGFNYQVFWRIPVVKPKKPAVKAP